MKYISIDTFYTYKFILNGYVFWRVAEDMIELYQVTPNTTVKKLLLTF